MTAPAHLSYIPYGWEATYATATTQLTNTFGLGVKLTNLNRKNNVEPLYSMGYRNAQSLPVKSFEGAFGVEMTLANPWFFRAVMGGVATAGTAPYVHTFAEADTIPSFTIVNNINSSTKSVAKLLGCKVANMTLSTSINETVKIKLDGMYANESHTSTTVSNVAETEDPMTFAHGTLELPNGTTLAQVEAAELTIANNPKMIWGLGSRVGQDCVVTTREYTSRINMAYQAFTNLHQLTYGQAASPADPDMDEQASMQLTFSNGLTGNDMRKTELTFTGVQIDEENLPQDPAEVIMEDVSVKMRSGAIIVSNGTTTAL